MWAGRWDLWAGRRDLWLQFRRTIKLYLPPQLTINFFIFSVPLLFRKFHEPLPVVPLKILAHNELVGRVIGKVTLTVK